MRPVSPAADPFLHAARDLAPQIVAARDAIEAGRRIPAALAEAMRTAGLFHLWLPEALGGPELHPLDFLSVVEIISAADASAAWCAINGSIFSLLAGALDPGAAADVFAERAIVSGSLNPLGKAVRAEGGYRVTGRWTYGSGVQNCGWAVGNCVIHDESGPRRLASGAPEMRFLFFPRSAIEIFDTWRVGGLRGTGSHDFAVEHAFVPEARSLPAFATAGVQPGVLYRTPLLSLFCHALAAVVLGNARTALDAFKEMAQAKIPAGGQALLRDRPSAQADVARAEATLRAARAGLVEAIELQWDEVAAGGAPSLEKHAGVRIAATFAGEASLRAIEWVYNAAGGSAILDSGRIDRCWRDARAAVQHIGLTTQTYEVAGRVLFGLDPGTPRF